MKIEILGTGCPKCKKLYENVQEAVKQKNIDAEILKVTEINEIMEYGIMITPALVVDGEVKAAGKIPSVNEIVNWITV
ncbi:MAG: TM0996/MTH895 family glutaredoxin-like protein [Candidatus Omnitrophica bacterium]|nr:TM0996/MTH895 family glutaredoxin-like protein [Candidatus Omnitrophota bacterium]